MLLCDAAGIDAQSQNVRVQQVVHVYVANRMQARREHSLVRALMVFKGGQGRMRMADAGWVFKAGGSSGVEEGYKATLGRENSEPG